MANEIKQKLSEIMQNRTIEEAVEFAKANNFYWEAKTTEQISYVGSHGFYWQELDGQTEIWRCEGNLVGVPRDC